MTMTKKHGFANISGNTEESWVLYLCPATVCWVLNPCVNVNVFMSYWGMVLGLAHLHPLPVVWIWQTFSNPTPLSASPPYFLSFILPLHPFLSPFLLSLNDSFTFLFIDRVSLYNPGWSQIRHVAQSSIKLLTLLPPSLCITVLYCQAWLHYFFSHTTETNDVQWSIVALRIKCTGVQPPTSAGAN